MLYILYAILSAFFAALVAIFGKLGLKDVDPTIATTVRVAVMMAFFLVVATALSKWKLISQIDNHALGWIAASGIAGAISWFFYFIALKAGPVGVVTVIDRTSVVFALVFAALFLAEGITWKTGLGGLLVLAGAILVSIK
ncbi:MAG: EamA family transporter [Patescibacteria group bacterium]